MPDLDQSSASTSNTGTAHEAFKTLLGLLRARDYHFVTPTPATHARVIGRPGRETARTVEDVLGWSLPFEPAVLPTDILAALDAANALVRLPDGQMKASVRVSSVHGTLFLHSAFPTDAVDAVFLGPDSYRFADYILAKSAPIPAGGRILDYGAGAGVGGITAAGRWAGTVLTLADINPKALALASINAEVARIDHVTVQATSPAELDSGFDLIVTHPPFMMDEGKRAYRDGGDLYGARLSLDWVLAGIETLARGGRLLLHTGIAIVGGRDLFREQIVAQVTMPRWTVDYHDLDPDIFSEDLDQPAYAKVDRIAAVGLCIARPASSALNLDH